MNSIRKEKIVPDNSQLNSALLVQWEEENYICLLFHIKTLWFFKHRGAHGIQLLHVGGLNAMPAENRLLRLLSSFAANINMLQSEINAVHASEDIQTLNGTS